MRPDLSQTFFNNITRQAIINGNMDVWQRCPTGATNPVNNAYVADRWKVARNITGTSPTVSHIPYTLTSGELDGSIVCYRFINDGPGSGLGGNDYYGILQSIEHGNRYLCNGKYITISFYARSSISGKRLGVDAQQYYGTGGSPSATQVIQGTVFNLTSSWKKYVLTLKTNSASGKTFGTGYDDSLDIAFFIQWGGTCGPISFGSNGTAETFGLAGTVDITQVQVCSGDKDLEFMPRPHQEELTLCMRYYEKSYDIETAIGATTWVGASYGIINSINLLAVVPGLIQYKVPKRITPSILAYSPVTGAVGKMRNNTSGTDVSVGITSTNSKNQIGLYCGTNQVAGHEMYFHWIADADF